MISFSFLYYTYRICVILFEINIIVNTFIAINRQNFKNCFCLYCQFYAKKDCAIFLIAQSIFFTLCFSIRFFGYIPFSLLLLYMFSLYLFFNPYPIIYISLDQIIYNSPQRHSYKKSDYSKQSISKEDRKYHPEWREPG